MAFSLAHYNLRWRLPINSIEFVMNPSNFDISNESKIHSINTDFRTINIRRHSLVCWTSIFQVSIMPMVIIVGSYLYDSLRYRLWILWNSMPKSYWNIDKENACSHSFSKIFLITTFSELGLFSSSVLPKLIDIVNPHWICFFRRSIMTLIQ